MERGSWQWEGGGFWLEVPDSQYEERIKDGGRVEEQAGPQEPPKSTWGGNTHSKEGKTSL